MREEDVLMDKGKADPVLLSQFEESLSIRFPASYRALIQEHNALYPIRNHFRFNNKYYNELWSYRLEDDGADSRDVVFFWVW